MDKIFYVSGQPTVHSSEGPRKITVETVENRLYFYSSITEDRALDFNRSIRQLKNDMLRRQAVEEQSVAGNIYINIHSHGGEFFAGMAMMDELIGVKKSVPVTTVIDGCCASAASFISIVGSNRLINAHAHILIHQMQSIFWGKYEEFTDEMKNLKKFMKLFTDVYSEYTKIPSKVLSTILKHDLWLNPKEALKYGLVDDIIT